jgi:cobalt-zinc-cadmium efflux system protein
VVAVGGAALVANALSAKIVTEPLHAHGDHTTHSDNNGHSANDHHHDHDHGDHAHTAVRDLNMRSVLVHMMGDAAASLAVVVAGIFVLAGGRGWDRADPAASLVVALLIFWQAVKILRESADVLLESTPADIDLAALRREVTAVAGVSEVHDLHVWSLSSDYRALSAHVVLSGHPSLEEAQALGAKVRHRLGERFDIAHATLEMECERCDDVPDDPYAADEIHGPRVEARTRRSPE